MTLKHLKMVPFFGPPCKVSEIRQRHLHWHPLLTKS